MILKKKMTQKKRDKRFKTYKGPVPVPGKFTMKKYTPEELAFFMGVCNGGLKSIRDYYEKWGYEKMSLMDIMVIVQKEDFLINHQGSYRRLRSWIGLIDRLTDAIDGIILIKKFPYIKKLLDGDDCLDLGYLVTDIREYIVDLTGDFRKCQDHDIPIVDVFYQILYDLSHGFIVPEILSLEYPFWEEYENGDGEEEIFYDLVT